MKTRPGICRRKKTFAAREDAERVAANAPFKLRAYRCGLCRNYHLTSRTKGMKTPRHELGDSSKSD
ncbi:MAG: hypothetical protein AAF127_12300 [Pseudomonadota bacterium]